MKAPADRQTNAGKAVETADTAWEALSARDRRSDGKFVYAALTTGIYCRPSCPARHPLRRNTLFFATAEEAEREGFLACGRCCPGSNSLTLAEKCVRAVLDYIEAHSNLTVTLALLSQVTGLSPNHLQETFKRIAGISPKAFCDARRLAHFKARLKFGESIVTATYAAGYGSSRALYERASKSMGMTPSAYRSGGDGVQIRYAIIAGQTLVATTVAGACAVLVAEDEKLLFRQLKEEFPKALLAREKAPPAKWVAAVRSARQEDPLLSQLPTPLRGRLFQARVLLALR